jgi:RNA polymerase-interacting CarD/CdnL/TRCF family regulator
VKFKKGETVIYPQHGACVVQGTKKMEFFGEKQEYLIPKTSCQCWQSLIRACQATGAVVSRTIRKS